MKTCNPYIRHPTEVRLPRFAAGPKLYRTLTRCILTIGDHNHKQPYKLSATRLDFKSGGRNPAVVRDRSYAPGNSGRDTDKKICPYGQKRGSHFP